MVYRLVCLPDEPGDPVRLELPGADCVPDVGMRECAASGTPAPRPEPRPNVETEGSRQTTRVLPPLRKGSCVVRTTASIESGDGIDSRRSAS